MEGNIKLTTPEDDEDLEALRLAALQSLKKKSQSMNEAAPIHQFTPIMDKLMHYNGASRGKMNRGKFTRGLQGRGARNGQFNNWNNRNSNLIAVPMVGQEEEPLLEPVVKQIANNDIPKLILPQDRYCKVNTTIEKRKPTEGASSKFDRYNNSDDSESESDDDELCKSDTELKRSDSLEALMEELENEIQGNTANKVNKEDAVKPKPKKRRKSSVTLEPVPSETVEPKEDVVVKAETSPIVRPQVQNFQTRQPRKWNNTKPRRHINNMLSFNAMCHQPPPPEVCPQFPPIQNYHPQYNNQMYMAPPPALIYEAPPPPVLPPLHVAPPPIYERPLSPLTINTDAYSTNTLAPLSPRSAAFVLENRAIIEKRKRRSYSRSPTPPSRSRRSKTPKRLSLSPKRLSRSPPKRRSLTPVRKGKPGASPRKPIHDRLGTKPIVAAPLPSPPPPMKTEVEESVEDVVDPILEARKRKFERNELTKKEGVIRLKMKEEENVAPLKKEEETVGDELDDEDALLDDMIILDPKIDALFSDEESDSDNEGRFKTKQETQEKVAVLPFTKLTAAGNNGTKVEVKNLEERHSNKSRGGERRKRYRSRSPVKKSSSMKKSEKPKQFPVDGKRIEIKIKNPMKYEKISEEKITSGRKVEIERKTTTDVEVKDVGVGEADVEVANANDGDLRAQLSRKRAERQKHPLPDVVPTRLLQSALQGVGVKKNKKKTKEKSEVTEGKPPIHLRLGAVSSMDVFLGKKSRSKKSKGIMEQV